MATIALISLYDSNANGLRLLSANLREHGHRCHIIFLKNYRTRRKKAYPIEPDEHPWQGIGRSGRTFTFGTGSRITDAELTLLRDLLIEIEPDLIGMTVNTPVRTQAARVTGYLRTQLEIPVIWGGYDPTVNPGDCIRNCDYVCRGEGDQTIIDIAERLDRNRSFRDVRNLVFFRNNEIVLNPLHSLVTDLDGLPWRDNDKSGKYLIEDDHLIREYPTLNDREPGVYVTMSSRGCPYRCSYCCEAMLKDLYRGESHLRQRSPSDLIGELAAVKQTHPVTWIWFEDEVFGMDLHWLREFTPLYREQIGLPFMAYIYPSRHIGEILGLLSRAGLSRCCLALESGSARINREVYNRVYDRELFLKTASLCRHLGIDFYTDVITWNPYETESDLEATLDVLSSVEGTFDIWINRLFVLPGTDLAREIAADGVGDIDLQQEHLFSYFSRLFWIASFSPDPHRHLGIIRRSELLRNHPELLNPAVVEFLIRPLSALKSTARSYLPDSLLTRIRRIQGR